MDNEHPQLPAPLIKHECDNCGYEFLDDCQRVEFVEDDLQSPALPPAPVEYAQAIVVASAGISVSICLYRIVDQSFYMLQKGQLVPFDFNVVVSCVCTAFGLLAGYAWAKKKKEEKNDSDN